MIATELKGNICRSSVICGTNALQFLSHVDTPTSLRDYQKPQEGVRRALELRLILLVPSYRLIRDAEESAQLTLG